MASVLTEAFEQETDDAGRLYFEGLFEQAFKRLGTAHVLGPRHIRPHV